MSATEAAWPSPKPVPAGSSAAAAAFAATAVVAMKLLPLWPFTSWGAFGMQAASPPCISRRSAEESAAATASAVAAAGAAAAAAVAAEAVALLEELDVVLPGTAAMVSSPPYRRYIIAGTRERESLRLEPLLLPLHA